jgi:Permuted papain-like amidase enzyme, YaeF/YiiX, C92 family
MKQIVFLLILGIHSLGLSQTAKWKANTFRSGDLIFQTSKSSQSLAIQKATNSPYSHCGIIYLKKGKVYVFEASTQVKKTPLARFIQKGVGQSFVVKRLRKSDSVLTPENLAKLEKTGKAMEGRPYDPFFSWDEKRIYCSELVYKVYFQALGIQIGSFTPFKDFDLSSEPVQEIMKKRFGSRLPLEEPVVSPASQFQDADLIEVFNNYPAQK